MYLSTRIVRIELNARCRARSTSDKYSTITISIRKSFRQRPLERIVPEICGEPAARLFDDCGAAKNISPMLIAGGFDKGDPGPTARSFRLSIRDANS